MVSDFVYNYIGRPIQKAGGHILMAVPKYPKVAIALIFYGAGSLIWDVVGLFR